MHPINSKLQLGRTVGAIFGLIATLLPWTEDAPWTYVQISEQFHIGQGHTTTATLIDLISTSTGAGVALGGALFIVGSAISLYKAWGAVMQLSGLVLFTTTIGANFVTSMAGERFYTSVAYGTGYWVAWASLLVVAVAGVAEWALIRSSDHSRAHGRPPAAP